MAERGHRVQRTFFLIHFLLSPFLAPILTPTHSFERFLDGFRWMDDVSVLQYYNQLRKALLLTRRCITFFFQLVFVLEKSNQTVLPVAGSVPVQADIIESVVQRITTAKGSNHITYTNWLQTVRATVISLINITSNFFAGAISQKCTRAASVKKFPSTNFIILMLLIRLNYIYRCFSSPCCTIFGKLIVQLLIFAQRKINAGHLTFHGQDFVQVDGIEQIHGLNAILLQSFRIN